MCSDLFFFSREDSRKFKGAHDTQSAQACFSDTQVDYACFSVFWVGSGKVGQATSHHHAEAVFSLEVLLA